MDTNTNILSIIRGEVNDFLHNSIEIVPGYNFNQYDTIKRCHLYLNSKFEDQSKYQGRDKMFDNKIKPKRDRVTAFLNIDTKDIKAISKSGSSNPYKTMIAQKELDYHLKDNDYAKKLNDLNECGVDFGSAVVMKAKGKDLQIDLRRLFIDPTVENLQKSRFVTVKFLFTISELREKVKDGWDENVIEDIIAWKERMMDTSNAGTSYEKDGQLNVIRSSPYIEVYQRFGEVKEYLLQDKGQSQKIVESLFIVAEPMSFSTNEKGEFTGENGGILFKSKWHKDYPFDEWHYQKTPGRWLGIGVTEALFIPQERINELVNQKRVSMELSTMHLFQTKGTSLVSNIITDLQNGDVLTGLSNSIDPIANEERNLAAFQSEEVYYQQSMNDLSFISDQAAGGAIPSSTPATNAVIQQNNVTSVMMFKRQNFANFLRRYLRTFVLPDLLKNISVAHILRYTGDYTDMSKLSIALSTAYATHQADQKIGKGTPVDLPEYQEMIVKNLQTMKGKKDIDIMIQKGWFDDIDLDFDILIDNEQQATDVIANNTWQVIQALAANPQALENPVTRALIFDYAEKVGINPTKLEGMDVGIPQPQQGGQMPNMQPQQSANAPLPVRQPAGVN